MAVVFDDGLPAAPDAGPQTLHLRCGDDIRTGLVEAGFKGEFGKFAYPFVHGPAPSGDDRAAFIEIGTRYLIDAGFTASEADTRRSLLEEFMLLDASLGIERVCLWFEHDAYDVLCLLFLLDWYSKNGVPETLTFLCCESHPTVEPFHGIGQLSPAALRDVWTDFAAVTPEMLAFGAEAWAAYTAPDPTRFWDITQQGTPLIPPIAAALHRQLCELPAPETGLSLTETLTLRALADTGDLPAGQLFRRYMLDHEPLVFMGDLGFRQCVLLPLASGENPAISLETGEGDNWWRSTDVALTDTGRALLAADADWMEIAAVDRWVGGVNVKSGAPVWRYRAETGAPVFR